MSEEQQSNGKLSRRHFLSLMGAGVATGAATLVGCGTNTDGIYDPSGNYTGDIPTDQMTYRTTPTSGDRVSLLGYGCMRWPMMPNPNGEGQVIDQETVNGLVDFAMAHGVNYFDTSPHYGRGQSERATGTALARHPRESFYLTTKMSSFLDSNGDSREVAQAGYERSFRECRVDYLDYYLIHGAGIGGMDTLHKRLLDNGMLEFLLEEKKKGRIRNLGFSFHGELEVFDYLLSMQDSGDLRWDAVQIQMNYVDWHHASGWNTNAEYLYNELVRRGIPVIIMEPLLGGRLSNMPQVMVAEMKRRSPNDSVASWAFRFSGSHQGVLTCLSGMTYMEHLQDNLRAFAPLKPLTDDEMAWLSGPIADQYSAFPIVQCNSCQYCMPCPYGIDIPGIFVHYNKCVNEGNLSDSRQDPDYRHARRAFLVGYDRSVPRLRQADHCTGCNQCTPKCPQRIQIPQEMQRINAYAESLKQNTL